MKLRGGKKQPQRAPGRQRQQSDWRAPAAFSYHAQRSQRPEAPGRQAASLADERHRLLSLRFWAKRSGLLVALIAGFICFISIISVSNTPRIVFLDEQNTSAAFHDTSTYARAAEEYLGKSVWNKNKLTINTGAASDDLRKKYPELGDVSITLPLVGHRPIYYLRANPPALVMQSVNGTYVLDSSGTALLAKDAADERVVANLPVITDQTGIHVVVGRQVISGAETAFIQTVVATLAAKQVTVSSMILPSGAVQQLDVRVADKPYVIKFNMHDTTTVRQQVGTYLATASNLSGQQVVPAQYIDVRVPGRAYYQ